MKQARSEPDWKPYSEDEDVINDMVIRTRYTIMKKCRPLAGRAGYRYDDPEYVDLCDEAAARAIAIVYKNRDWDPSKSRFHSWLATKAISYAEKDLRRILKARGREVSLADLTESLAEAISHEDDYHLGGDWQEDSENNDFLEAAFAQLTSDQREIMEYKFHWGYPNRIIAVLSGRTPASVASLVKRGLASVRQFYEERAASTATQTRRGPPDAVATNIVPIQSAARGRHRRAKP